MKTIKLYTLAGCLLFVLTVGLLMVPDFSTCSVNAQGTGCADLAATNSALELENSHLRATLDAQKMSQSPANICLMCINSLEAALTALPPEATDSGTPSSAAFSEDFASDHGSFNLVKGAQIANGELSVTTDLDGAYVLVPLTVAPPAQITVQARLSAAAINSTDTAIDILYGDIQQSSYTHVRIDPKYVDVLQMLGEQDTLLQSLQSPPLNGDWSQYQTIKITLGDTLNVYINNQLIGIAPYERTGSQLALGIIHYGEAAAAPVFFDNLQISPLAE